MPSQVTDDWIQASRLVRRRCVLIPKDQQHLLDDSAWSETLNRGIHPMLNVPARVLRDVKDVLIQQNVQPTHPASGSPPSTADSARLTPESRQPSTPSEIDQTDERDETPLFSWDPTQESETGRADRGGLGEESVETELLVQHQRSPQPKSQPKRKTPPLLIDNHPQSSGAVSAGLDYEPPGFVSQDMEPAVNRTASPVIDKSPRKPEPTPPSAQMPTATAQGTANPPPAKRRRMEDSRGAAEEQKPMVPRPACRPSQKSVFAESNQNSLSTSSLIASAPSPSLGTRHAREGPSQPGEQMAMSDPGRHQQTPSLPPTYEGRRRGTAAQDLVITGTSLPGPSFAPPPAQPTVPKGPSDVQMPSLQTPQTLYEKFKAAYPDYSEKCKIFDGALRYLRFLKRELLVHEYLYDDFIRAFSSDYFEYVHECHCETPEDGMLKGIEWYNDVSADVLYTKKVVRKSNLGEEEVDIKDEELDLAMDEEEEVKKGSQWQEFIIEPDDDNDDDDDDASRAPRVHCNGSSAIHRRSVLQALPDAAALSAGPVMEPAQSVRDHTPAAALEAPQESIEEDMEKADEQMVAADEEAENLEAALSVDGHGRHSPEFLNESPNAATIEEAETLEAPIFVDDHERTSPECLNESSNSAEVIKTPDRRGDVSKARNTPAPSSGFASQEEGDGHDLFQSPVSPRRNERQVHGSTISPSSYFARTAPLNTQHAQRQPTISPPTCLARASSSKVSPKLVAEEEEEDEEDAFEPQPMPPPKRAATRPSYSTQPILVSSDEEDEDAIDLPMLLTRKATRPPSSSTKPQDLPVDAGTADSHEWSWPLQDAAASAIKPSTIICESTVADETDQGGARTSQLPGAMAQKQPASIAKPGHVEARPQRPLRPKARKSPALTARPTLSPTTELRPLMTSTMPPAASASLGGNDTAHPTKPAAMASKARASSVVVAGPGYNRASSISSAKGSRLSQSQRSARLKEFARKRAAGTPSSTATSKQ